MSNQPTSNQPSGEATTDTESMHVEATDQVFESNDELVALRSELDETVKRELRAQAELENFRKRIQRDTDQQLKFASVPLVRDLLEVLDNLNRATQAAEGQSNAESLLAGVRMVQQQMLGVFAKYSCTPIAALGQPFDPNIHQAIAQSPSDEFDSGLVMLETSVGYMMHDRVVRPSQVIVSTGKSS